MDRKAVTDWVDGYERAWRAAGTGGLEALFSAEVHYVPSPWATAVEGLDELRRFWEANRDGPDEAFAMVHEVVAVEGSTAVVRVAVDYHGADTARWRDLWVIKFGHDGRCAVFEEWPFARTKQTATEISPTTEDRPAIPLDRPCLKPNA